MTEPIVSVIMPAYNCRKVIGRAVRSVLEQDVPLELLIIDDASTDHLEECVDQWADPRIRYVRNSANMGVARSRNRGVSLSRGRYVAFLDADDWWSPDKLKKQLPYMESKNAVLCGTGRELFSAEGKPLGRQIHVPSRITYRMLLRGNSISCSSVLVLRTVAQEFPMRKDNLHEDYITWLNILKKYKFAVGIDEPLLKYRMSKGSKSGNKLKSARMTFGVYRFMGYSLPVSCYYFACYCIHGVLKYL